MKSIRPTSRCVVMVGAAAVVAAASGPPAGATRVKGPFGRGAAQVMLVVPSGRPRAIVVFGHGWKSAPPATPLAWVEQFCPWIDHLASRGSLIVFPRYQTGANDTLGAERVAAYRRGLTTAFAHLSHTGVPVVAAGYSYGASLAMYYAANARQWHLPAPSAVDAVFPAGLISGAPLPSLAPAVRVLLQVGDDDTEAGVAGAAPFWAWLRPRSASRKRYDLVPSARGFTATHAAPKRSGRAARRAFWLPLDGLIASAEHAAPAGGVRGAP